MPFEIPEDALLISNSELDTDQKCNLRAYYAHGMEIRRKDLGEPLERGIYGHKLFEKYWLARLDGLVHTDALQRVFEFHIPESLRIARPAVTSVLAQVQAALDWFNSEGIVPVEVETVKKYPIEGLFIRGRQVVFCLTPDLVAMATKGQHKGQLIVVDYKFAGQYWSKKAIDNFQQIDKYTLFLNKFENYGVRRGLLLQVNTRSNASASAQVFLPKWLYPTKKKMDQIWHENLILLKRYGEKKALELEEWKSISPRVLNPKTCDFCPFSEDLCPQEFEGRPVATTLKAHYRKNDYGYSSLTE